MKREDLAKMMSTALITFVIALAVFGPAFIDANDEGGTGRKIENPKLAAGGVEFRLNPVDNRTFKEGEEPMFEVTAVNTTDQPTTVTIETLMTSAPKPPRMLRTPPRSLTLWQESRTLSRSSPESVTGPVRMRTPK